MFMVILRHFLHWLPHFYHVIDANWYIGTYSTTLLTLHHNVENGTVQFRFDLWHNWEKSNNEKLQFKQQQQTASKHWKKKNICKQQQQEIYWIHIKICEQTLRQSYQRHNIDAELNCDTGKSNWMLCSDRNCKCSYAMRANEKKKKIGTNTFRCIRWILPQIDAMLMLKHEILFRIGHQTRRIKCAYVFKRKKKS